MLICISQYTKSHNDFWINYVTLSATVRICVNKCNDNVNLSNLHNFWRTASAIILVTNIGI